MSSQKKERVGINVPPVALSAMRDYSRRSGKSLSTIILEYLRDGQVIESYDFLPQYAGVNFVDRDGNVILELRKGRVNLP